MLSTSNKDKERVTIDELRREIEELRQNEKDYHDLNFLLTSLENKYAMLAEEKRLIEVEFADRSEIQIRHIAALKVEVDTFKEALARTQRQLDEAQAEVTACRDVADHKQINTDRIKLELKAAFDTNTRLKEDNSSLETQLRWHKEEKRSLVDRLDSLSQSIEEVMEKNEDLERMLEECEKDKRNLSNLNAGLQNEYEILSEETRQKSIMLNELEMQSSHAMKQVQILDSDLQSKLIEFQRSKIEVDDARVHLQRTRDELFETSSRLEDAYTELKSLQKNHSALLNESKNFQEVRDSFQKRVDETEIKRAKQEEETKRVQLQLQEARTIIKRIEREIDEKSALLSEMERSSAKALQTILRLEGENKEIINDYAWIRQQHEETNQNFQAECAKNEDLLNANRDLEETIRENNEAIAELERRDKELREISEEIMEVNRDQKRDIVQYSQQLDEAQRVESHDKQQINQLTRKINDLTQELNGIQGQVAELKSTLTRQSQQLESKEQTMQKIEDQSKTSLSTLLKLEEEHKKQQHQNSILAANIQETSSRLEEARRHNSELEAELRASNEYTCLQAKNLQEMRVQFDDLVAHRQVLLSDVDRLQRSNALLESQNHELQDNLQNIAKEDLLLKQLNEKKREIRETRLREEHQLKLSLSNLKSTLQNNTPNMNSFTNTQHTRSAKNQYQQHKEDRIQEESDYYDSRMYSQPQYEAVAARKKSQINNTGIPQQSEYNRRR